MCRGERGDAKWSKDIIINLKFKTVFHKKKTSKHTFIRQYAEKRYKIQKEAEFILDTFNWINLW